MDAKRLLLATGLILAGLVSAAHGQTANATAPSSNPGGPNQAQQFPSGGTAAPNGTAAPDGGSKIGAPTAVERQEQRKSDADTQICKGC